MSWHNWTAGCVGFVLVFALAPPAVPFSIDKHAFTSSVLEGRSDWGAPVHEAITRAALEQVSRTKGPTVQERVIRHIIRGNQNTDGLDHKFDNVYHVNSANTSNGAFVQSFTLIQNHTAAAVEQARNNARFLAPRQDTLQQTLDQIANTLLRLGTNPGCVTELACPKTELLAKASVWKSQSLRLIPIPMPDPHSKIESPMISNLRTDIRLLLDPPAGKSYCRPFNTHCFGRLDQMLTSNADFQADVRRLHDLAEEVRAYLAWQNVGHAFHTMQDFFAHSNFVELINRRAGPPCGQRHNPAICDSALGPPPSRRDLTVTRFLNSLRPGFSLNLQTLQTILGTSFQRLQTGFVRVSVGVNLAGLYCPDSLPADFNYCHWPHKNVPGLNKDDSTDSENEPARANHAYARQVAVYASEVLWEHFLRQAGFLPQ